MKKQCAAVKVLNGYKIAYETDIADHRAIKLGEMVMLEVKTKGIPRSYQELKLYRACLKAVADNTEDPNFDTPEKVDLQCKIAVGFIEASIKANGQWIPITRSLSYANTPQKEAHEYIAKAIEHMVQLLGITKEELINNIGNL